MRKSAQDVEADAPRESLHLVVIGASAGGLHSLMEVVSRLDAGLPLSVLIIQHLDPKRLSLMAEILSTHTPMKVQQAHDGEEIHRGFIYTSTPGKHLLVRGHSLVLSVSEPVDNQRPSIDVTFNSAADSYKQNCTAVVLSGMLADGAKGIKTVKAAGGTTIVEDPETAEFDGMPKAAVATGCVDHILKLTEIGPMLNRICAG